MRVVRGRLDSAPTDRSATRAVVESVAQTGESVLRVWQPPQQVAFGRRDTTRTGFERARETVTSRGIPAIERSTGGHAVYFTGTTLSFVRADPVQDGRTGIEDRYEKTIPLLQSALSDLAVDATRGEPDGAFCPGTHSLSVTGKVVGLAQRVRRNVAVVAGIVVVQDHEQIAELLAPVYDALDVPFDPDTVGSIARACGDASPANVRAAIEEELTPPGTAVKVQSIDSFSAAEFS